MTNYPDLADTPLGRTWAVRPWDYSLAAPDGLVEVNGVLGYLHPGDCSYLFDKAALLPHNGRYLEVGSFMGLSAICFATGLVAQLNLGARVHCLDTWRGSPEHQHMPEVRDGRLVELFCENVTAAGVDHLVIPHKGTLQTFAPGCLFDMVFIDAAHDYHSAYADVTAALDEFVRPGGHVFGHDCVPGSGVEAAVKRVAAERGLTAAVLPEPATHWVWELWPSAALVPPGRRALS